MKNILSGFPAALKRFWKSRAAPPVLAAMFSVLTAGILASGRMAGRPSEAFSRSEVKCELHPAAHEDRAEEDPGQNADDYLYWGGLLSAINPSLTGGEIYEIGRAVARYSRDYGLPPRLVVAIITVESSGVSRAVSPKGARGLMQVMPWWMDALGVEGDLFDIDTNIRLGCRILSDNIRRWGHKEGILRYYRGGTIGVGEGYFVKVQKALDEIEG